LIALVQGITCALTKKSVKKSVKKMERVEEVEVAM
jgi:hypothetical protein